MKMIEQLDPMTRTDRTRLDLAYRLLQSNETQRALEVIDAMSVAEPMRDELSALRIVTLLSLDRTAEAETQLKNLNQRDSQLAVTWRPVLTELLRSPRNNAALVKSTNTAVEQYPQSAFLNYYHAIALQSVAESDLAVVALRKATRLAPRWLAPRIQLANELMQRREFRTAFAESTVAFRIGPQVPAVYDLLITSIIANRDVSDKMTPERIAATTKLLLELEGFADNERTARTLATIRQFVEGEQTQVDQSLTALLADPNVTGTDLRLYSKLTSTPHVLEAIQKSSDEKLGDSIPTIAATAAKLYQQSGESAGLQFITEYKVNGESLPTLSFRLAVNGMHSIVDSPDAVDRWMSLARDYANNARIVTMILSQPILQPRFHERRELIGLLKAATDENAIQWQIAEVRLNLDENDSQRMAAKSVLRLTKLTDICRNSLDLYLLLDESYTRLAEPTKALSALTTGIDQNLNHPLLPIRAAEISIGLGDKTQSRGFAELAAKKPQLTPAERQRIAAVFLKIGQSEAAAEELAKILPGELTDRDDLFVAFSTYATAATQAGLANQVEQRLKPYIALGDRWFDLWLNLPRLREFPADMVSNWLGTAESHLKTLERNESERRKLTGTWIAVARNQESKSAWKSAAASLKPLISADSKDSDLMMMAGISNQLGEARESVRLYSQVVKTSTNKQTRVAALNNLANLLSKNAPAKAEAIARQAMEIQPLPSVLDTLASILIDQSKSEEAVTLLNSRRADYPQDTKIRIRLAEVLLESSDLKLASDVIQELGEINQSVTNINLKSWKKIRELQRRLDAQRQLIDQQAVVSQSS
jgi:predicted Zn-dependent protease